MAFVPDQKRRPLLPEDDLFNAALKRLDRRINHAGMPACWERGKNLIGAAESGHRILIVSATEVDERLL